MNYRPSPPLILLRRFFRSIQGNGLWGALAHAWLRLYQSLRNHGLSGTLERAFLKAPNAPAASEAQLPPPSFDITHGTETAGIVSSAKLEAVSLSALYATGYLGSPPSTLRQALATLPIRHEEFSFVDIGCGKGRALLVAAELPFRHLYGVEIAVELARTAMANVSLRPDWKERISVTNQDAAKFSFPDGPLVLYFYNPFFNRILRRVLKNLERELRRLPRAVFLIFGDIYRDEANDGATHSTFHRYRNVMAAMPCFSEVSDAHYRLSAEEAAQEPSRCNVSRFVVYSANVRC